MAATSKAAKSGDDELEAQKAELAAELKKAQKLTADLTAKLANAPAAPAPAAGSDPQKPGSLFFWHRCPAVDATKKGKPEICKAPQYWDAGNPEQQHCVACGENPGAPWVLRTASGNHNLPVHAPTEDELAAGSLVEMAQPAVAVKNRQASKKFEQMRQLSEANLREINTPDLN